MDDRTKNALEVAYLLTLDENISQEYIKDKLGFRHQSEVSRLISYAKGKKWLRQAWILNWPVGPSERDLIISSINAQNFADKGVLEQRVLDLAIDRTGIVPSIHVINDKLFGDDKEQNRREFGWRSAEYIRKYLTMKETTTCAVAWGDTVRSVVSMMGGREPDDKYNVRFVPTAGTPWTQRLQRIESTSSYLVSEMSKKFGVVDADIPSLEGIPVRIPEQMKDEAVKIREYLATSADYGKIFVNDGTGVGLMEKVDMILAGIGDTKTSKDDPTFMELEKMEPGLDISRYSDGNIGGVWIARDISNIEDVNVVNGVNRRWLGISYENVLACLDRARRNKGQGVFIVAMEKEKVNILYSAIGYVNHMIITQSLAESLNEKLSGHGTLHAANAASGGSHD